MFFKKDKAIIDAHTEALVAHKEAIEKTAKRVAELSELDAEMHKATTAAVKCIRESLGSTSTTLKILAIAQILQGIAIIAIAVSR